jgi:hypothetical protein|tara:strand:+ start:1118 stop:1243 length:126 start_codon:yes stop_codon:yes gene_type:complete
MNVERLTKRLSVSKKTLKLPTKHMPAILDMLEYLKQQGVKK